MKMTNHVTTLKTDIFKCAECPGPFMFFDRSNPKIIFGKPTFETYFAHCRRVAKNIFTLNFAGHYKNSCGDMKFSYHSYIEPT